jgi:hypothetical protein
MTAGTRTLAEQTLLFVNHTGHERLVEGHPVYALGGRAAMSTILSGSIQVGNSTGRLWRSPYAAASLGLGCSEGLRAGVDRWIYCGQTCCRLRCS